MIEIAADDPRLLALLQLYVYDLSETFGIDVGDDGRYRTPDPSERCCFLHHHDDKLAGFALVGTRSRLSGDEGVYDMAEFFVMRKFRRQGVGEQAAAWLFDYFRGPWEVRERSQNQAATAFWRRVIGRYTSERFEELQLDDERWRGPVQRFDSRR